MKHGTVNAYNNGCCRCDQCRKASTDYQRQRRDRIAGGTFRPAVEQSEPERRLGDLLDELFPDGLTDDCPARQRRMAA